MVDRDDDALASPTLHLVVSWPSGTTDVVNLVRDATATVRRVWVNKYTAEVVTELPAPTAMADHRPLAEWQPAFRVEVEPALAFTVDHYEAADRITVEDSMAEEPGQ